MILWYTYKCRLCTQSYIKFSSRNSSFKKKIIIRYAGLPQFTLKIKKYTKTCKRKNFFISQIRKKITKETKIISFFTSFDKYSRNKSYCFPRLSVEFFPWKMHFVAK